MHLLPLIFGALLISETTSAQSSSDLSSKFWDNIKIRKSFESEDDKANPASTSLTIPQDGKSSYLINGAISYSLFKVWNYSENRKDLKMTFAPVFTLNKNTMIDKEQNNYKAGITQNWKLGSYSGLQQKLNYWSWSNTVEYSHDRMDTSHSMIVTSYLSLIHSKKNGLYINTYKDIGKGFQYFISVNGGLEFQDKFKSSDSSMKGNMLRGYYNVEARLALKIDKTGVDAKLGQRFIEIGINNTGRYDVLNSTLNREFYLPLFKAEISIYPTMQDAFKVGFSFNTGSDPIAGLAKQQFYLLALQYKL